MQYRATSRCSFSVSRSPGADRRLRPGESAGDPLGRRGGVRGDPSRGADRGFSPWGSATRSSARPESIEKRWARDGPQSVAMPTIASSSSENCLRSQRRETRSLQLSSCAREITKMRTIFPRRSSVRDDSLLLSTGREGIGRPRTRRCHCGTRLEEASISVLMLEESSPLWTTR